MGNRHNLPINIVLVQALVLLHNITAMTPIPTLPSIISEALKYPHLNVRQIAILGVVTNEKGPHHVRTLAIRLQLSRPAISRNIMGLKRYGFVHKHKREADRRDFFVEPSTSGLAFLKSGGAA